MAVYKRKGGCDQRVELFFFGARSLRKEAGIKLCSWRGRHIQGPMVSMGKGLHQVG